MGASVVSAKISKKVANLSIGHRDNYLMIREPGVGGLITGRAVSDTFACI